VSKNWPLPSYAVSWLAPNKHFLVFPISRNRTLNVVAFVTRPKDQLGELKESWTSSAPREELEREYEGWDPTVQRIISCMEPRPGKWRLNDRELLKRWTYLDGKVVLLGDAAHAMLPHQGRNVPYSAGASPSFSSQFHSLPLFLRLPLSFLPITPAHRISSRLRRRPRNRRHLHPRALAPRLLRRVFQFLLPFLVTNTFSRIFPFSRGRSVSDRLLPSLHIHLNLRISPSSPSTKGTTHVPPSGGCLRDARSRF
jgi:hypothetical protein